MLVLDHLKDWTDDRSQTWTAAGGLNSCRFLDAGHSRLPVPLLVPDFFMTLFLVPDCGRAVDCTVRWECRLVKAA